ncbi:MraY family glycosyltransferase [Adlercreutzia sp. ZJ304]|uniref:glycosyltransferase family 4 protein n=1 Tax=Adlercreutzia sp. ZJ304 TaxID=2709791 RepID=UPI0013EC4F8B|nr:MraY family glycosyltransferase [Adlercreutzia sp. ZJ304]
MNWLECGILLAVAIAATIACTPLAKRIAFITNAIDYPDQRRINTKPIPRMGGVAIFIGMIVSIAVLKIGTEFFGWIDPFYSYLGFDINYWLLCAGVIFMFAVGLVDDIKNLSAKVKLVGQIISACLVSASGLLLSNIQNPFIEGAFINFGLFSYPITVFYLVAFANIINLIDGLDGLASGISAISAATIFTFAVLAHRLDAAILAIIIIGVCIGFLRYNFNPASIFMGDSGSLLLGLTLGIVSLLAVARSTLFISLMVPIMAAGVPVIDTAMAIIRRVRAHQPIDAPDRGHIHHRLLSAGFSQRKTVLIMWGWTALLAICSIMIAETDGLFRAAVIVLAAAVTIFFIMKLHLLDPVLLHHYNPRTMKPIEDGSQEDESE